MTASVNHETFLLTIVAAWTLLYSDKFAWSRPETILRTVLFWIPIVKTKDFELKSLDGHLRRKRAQLFKTLGVACNFEVTKLKDWKLMMQKFSE